MEQMKNKDEQRTRLDEADYIDVPAFIRRFLRYARKYILLALPLIICAAVCLAVFSRPYAKKNYVAGGTAMIGVQLSDSDSFDYTFSGLTWDRQAILAQMDHVFNTLIDSGYVNQAVKDYMGKQRNDELNGQIRIDSAYTTNLVDIYVVSGSPEDAEAIRDAVFACLPDAVFPALGFIELDIQELYEREEPSPRAFLTSPKVWAAGGAALGIIGYLGLVFLYALRRKDVETPGDLRKLTDLPCIGRIPALKKRIRGRKNGGTGNLDDAFIVTDEYRRAFDRFRRTVEDEIRRCGIRVILLTGCGRGKGQTVLVSELEKAWNRTGKKTVVTEFPQNEGPLTEEKVRGFLDQCDPEADVIMIDGPACDASADALVLADCADAMILVVREGRSQPEELREMFLSLKYAGAENLGYVLTVCSNGKN